MIGDILCVSPTLSYHKGEAFPIGESRRERIGRTGLWLLNTEGRADPHDLDAHIFVILGILFFNRESKFDLQKIVSLRNFILENNIDMRISLFWHGSSSEPEPQVRDNFCRLIRKIGGRVEADFEKEDSAPAAGTLEFA